MTRHPIRLLMAPLLLVALVLSGCSSPSPSEASRTSAAITLDVDGVDRDFLLRAPARSSSEELPVVIALHGLDGNPEDLESWTGLTDRIEDDQFIAVYPAGTIYGDGSTRGWNAGNCCNVAGDEKPDDIAFLSAILDLLPSYGADTDRIFVTGFSNGGMLSYYAACEIGDRIAGIAVVAGAYHVPECASTKRMPVIVIHGTSDEFIPYEGGDSPRSITDGLDPYTNPAVIEAVDIWLERDGCDGTGTTTVDGVVEKVVFAGCKDGSTVDLYTLDGGTHVWPTEEDGFDASEAILSTFLGT